MPQNNSYLAFDLGASSGRGILGILKDEKIELKEINRFYNGMTYVHGRYHWDIYRLYDEIKKGMQQCAQEGLVPDSIAFDTWGVDYGLLDEHGQLLQIPYAYRDHRTDTAIEEFSNLMPKDEIYSLTGIQFMQFNTLFQLYAAARDKQSILPLAKSLLFIPDLLDYFLTGIKKTEFTFATTSQLYNPVTMKWEKKLFAKLGISDSLMQEVLKPGTVFAQTSDEIAKETGLKKVDVTKVAAHDTGSAIVSIPALDENFAYISSGTWSLMGIESTKPLMMPKAMEYNFTNEGGVENTFRVLKNIMGLWLIQEARRMFQSKGEDYSYPQLVEMSLKANPFQSFINPNDQSFYNPENMLEAINNYCRKTGQNIPQNAGEYARLIYESLAFVYRKTLDEIRQISDKKIERIHIIGGGAQNTLLCQFTANATGLPVIAGPAEGTALGNIMIQALAKGHVKNLDHIRQIIKRSVEAVEYLPEKAESWDKAYERFQKIL